MPHPEATGRMCGVTRLLCHTPEGISFLGVRPGDLDRPRRHPRHKPGAPAAGADRARGACRGPPSSSRGRRSPSPAHQRPSERWRWSGPSAGTPTGRSASSPRTWSTTCRCSTRTSPPAARQRAVTRAVCVARCCCWGRCHGGTAGPPDRGGRTNGHHRVRGDHGLLAVDRRGACRARPRRRPGAGPQSLRPTFRRRQCASAPLVVSRKRRRISTRPLRRRTDRGLPVTARSSLALDSSGKVRFLVGGLGGGHAGRGPRAPPGASRPGAGQPATGHLTRGAGGLPRCSAARAAGAAAVAHALRDRGPGREILQLDVGDLDVANKRAMVIGKGGNAEPIGWETATARLLPRYLAGRNDGPLFLFSKSEFALLTRPRSFRHHRHREAAHRSLSSTGGRPAPRLETPPEARAVASSDTRVYVSVATCRRVSVSAAEREKRGSCRRSTTTWRLWTTT